MAYFQTPLPLQTGLLQGAGEPGLRAQKMHLKCLLNKGMTWEQQRLGMTLVPLSPLTKHCQLLGHLPLRMNPNPVPEGEERMTWFILFEELRVPSALGASQSSIFIS